MDSLLYAPNLIFIEDKYSYFLCFTSILQSELNTNNWHDIFDEAWNDCQSNIIHETNGDVANREI